MRFFGEEGLSGLTVGSVWLIVRGGKGALICLTKNLRRDMYRNEIKVSLFCFTRARGIRYYCIRDKKVIKHNMSVQKKIKNSIIETL